MVQLAAERDLIWFVPVNFPWHQEPIGNTGNSDPAEIQSCKGRPEDKSQEFHSPRHTTMFPALLPGPLNLNDALFVKETLHIFFHHFALLINFEFTEETN